MEKLLEGLNESQRVAVEYIDGASLVIAGAGSGKTRVLTYKIAYLLHNGYKPWEIMALTFTNKAAKEMKERIIQLTGDDARALHMGTFHSVFSHILRVEAQSIGYDSNFTIYDESDSRSLCKMLTKQLGLDEKIYKPAEVHKRISNAKNRLISPQEYAAKPNILAADREAKMPELFTIYDQYVKSCRKANAMDFDDLLVYTHKLLSENEEIRTKYAKKFRFVLVDEYQDTNYAQQQIVWLLTKEDQHICVVGDDAQSIYAFRGANIDNILDFQQLYQSSKLFKLERNYRSTQRIVQAANSLIRHNDRQIPKDVYSRNDEGEKIELRMLTSDKEEAAFVCKEIMNGARHGMKNWSDYAILYRTNSQSRTFEERMLKDNIPYRIYGGLSFYQRKEIKDVVAYFRLIVNPHDDEAFRRIINYPTRGIGDTTLNKLTAAAQAYTESIWTVSLNPGGYGVSITKGTEAKIHKFTDEMKAFAERLVTDDAFTLGEDIIKSTGISADIYSGTNPDDASRQENLEEFLSSMQDFVEANREEGLPMGLPDFLQDVSLLSDKESEGDSSANKVTLMTIHSAKGLEFPNVFVVGMEENIFPSPMSTDSIRKLEEERRLLYVAITRAEKHCTLTCAKSRYRYGRMEFDAPSRFLKDIDPKLMTVYANESSSNDSFGGSRFQGYGSGNTSYGGGYQNRSNRYQNSNPVASQFMADPKPRITAPKRNEEPVNPYSPAFQREIIRSGGMGSLKRVQRAMGASAAPSSNSGAGSSLEIGARVEHNRFGVGTVLSIEGSGDNRKATVKFDNTGTKQLLLKFANLKSI